MIGLNQDGISSLREEATDVVHGGSALHGGRVSSEGDHRIAMAAAIMGLVHGGLTVTGAEAVAKSYPGFFEDLDALTA